MKKIFPFLLIAIVIFSACEKNVTVNIPQRDPRLVINGWMEKNKNIEVMVGKSRNVLQPINSSGNNLENYVVKNAVPVVYENNIAIDTLIYQPSQYKYISTRNKTIRQGYDYTIKVNASGFSQAESFTLVPSQSEIAEMKRVKNARTNSNGETEDEVTIKLNDPVETNFYLIQIYSSSYGSTSGQTIYCVNTTDKDIEPIGENADPLSTDNCYDGGRLIMKDVNFNGRQKQLRFYINSYELMDHRGSNGMIYRPYVKVYRITEDYFKFVKSYSVYYNSSDNPFAEPANVFSNVKNGFGSFSAYTMAVDSLR